jgi:PAT family beta-lactamase induction signal transducer AmpG
MTATDEVRPAPADEQIADPDQHAAQSFWDSIRLLADRRLLIIFVFGVASGLPWLIVGSTMTAWLQETGLSRSSIGFFGSIFVAYSINFLWAPLVDRIPFPLTSKLGPRRSWIFAMQLIIASATFAIGYVDPSSGLLVIASLALAITISSATQDVAIDAYRVELIPRHETAVIAHGSAMATAGWWTGYGLLGVVPFYLVDLPGWSWDRVYVVLALAWVPLMAAVLLVPKSRQKRDKFAAKEKEYEAALASTDAERPSPWARFVAWLAVTVVEPVKEFFTRSGPKLAFWILVFIFTFKLGEAFLGRMSIVFYKEVGFTNEQIGQYSKLGTGLVTIVFAVLGSIINARFGLIKGLFLGGLSMAASNLMFSWIALDAAQTGEPSTTLYAAAIVIDGFTTAFSTVAFVAFISYLTSHTFTATQYALMASLGNLGRTLVSSASGAMVDGLGGNWNLFFIITSLMVLPSLAVLVYVAKLMKQKIPDWRGGRA